uniref:Uncharacterized protein n=1 Tax=Physcomitrium patens TaxID=3218 RepID=A0A2K1KXP8_PHYPA|nr:hypothetical protein PHYPA_005559 [Physcomitrium patens]
MQPTLKHSVRELACIASPRAFLPKVQVCRPRVVVLPRIAMLSFVAWVDKRALRSIMDPPPRPSLYLEFKHPQLVDPYMFTTGYASFVGDPSDNSPASSDDADLKLNPRRATSPAPLLPSRSPPQSTIPYPASKTLRTHSSTPASSTDSKRNY